MKSALGLLLAFAIGVACRVFGIPSPAPPVVIGAFLAMAMTIGYVLVDRCMADAARHALNCAGPTGISRSRVKSNPVDR
jgi:XapX domain-containing protein